MLDLVSYALCIWMDLIRRIKSRNFPKEYITGKEMQNELKQNTPFI